MACPSDVSQAHAGIWAGCRPAGMQCSMQQGWAQVVRASKHMVRCKQLGMPNCSIKKHVITPCVW